MKTEIECAIVIMITYINNEALSSLLILVLIRYYSAFIIQMSGFSDNASIWLATIPAAGNLVFTIVG